MNKIVILLLITFTISTAQRQDIWEKYLKEYYNKEELAANSINVALIGDYGTGDKYQKICAEQLNKIAKEQGTKYILGMGDNFYNPDGVTGLDDSAWDTHWADMYQNLDYLQTLEWYGTIGNHDFNGEGLFTEFEYRNHGWRIDDFFWAHTDEVQGASIAYIHIDTSFLAYGIQGENSKPLMGPYFEELEWQDNQQMLDMIDELLLEYAEYDWKIVMGHHQIGYSCPPVGNTGLIYNLLDKHNVSAYLSGHSHQLSYSQYNEIGFILSGAGGIPSDDYCSGSNPMWSAANTLGFINIDISSNIMDVTAHYLDSTSFEWKIHQLPSIKRKQ